MIHDIKNSPQIGGGIYSVPDIAHILRMPVKKVNRWITDYWDKEFSKNFGSSYSWQIGKSKTVNFHTLVELCISFQLSEADLPTKSIIEAHKTVGEIFNTPYPFASNEIISNIHTEGKKIYFKDLKQGIIFTLDLKRQLNLSFIQFFFKKLEFNEHSIANKLWPLGKDKHIIIDPSHQFGQPVIQNTNIYPETVYSMFIAGEPINFIAELYSITEQDISDAIEFCKAA